MGTEGRGGREGETSRKEEREGDGREVEGRERRNRRGRREEEMTYMKERFSRINSIRNSIISLFYLLGSKD